MVFCTQLILRALRAADWLNASRVNTHFLKTGCAKTKCFLISGGCDAVEII